MQCDRRSNSNEHRHEQQQQRDSTAAAVAAEPLRWTFNQDGSCLAVGSTTGFSVYELRPEFALSVHRQLRGGIAIVEMLFRCNVMALVGAGLTNNDNGGDDTATTTTTTTTTPNAEQHVLLWDDNTPGQKGELSFRSAVLGVRLRRDAVAVALRDRAYVYRLSDLYCLSKVDTYNPRGLLCLSTSVGGISSATTTTDDTDHVDAFVLACPYTTPGYFRVHGYGKSNKVPELRLYDAHKHELRSMAITADGTELATASVQGVSIRVWDLVHAVCLREFRRGMELADVTCLSWSLDKAWLGCTSDKGTAHVFQVPTGGGGGTAESARTTAAAGRQQRQPLLAAAAAETVGNRSVCQIRGVRHPKACTFVAEKDRTLAVAGLDEDGNSVLLVTEFTPGEEPWRVECHVLSEGAAAARRRNSGKKKKKLPRRTDEETTTAVLSGQDDGADLLPPEMDELSEVDGFVSVPEFPATSNQV